MVKNLNTGVSGNPTMLDEVTGIAGALCGMVDHVEGTKKNQKIMLRMGAPGTFFIESVCTRVLF